MLRETVVEETMSNTDSKIDLLRSRISELPCSDIFNYFRFFECGLLKKLIEESGLVYEDSDFVYKGSFCFRVEIFVSDPDDEDSDHYLVAPFRSMGSKSFQIEVI